MQHYVTQCNIMLHMQHNVTLCNVNLHYVTLCNIT